MIFEVLRFLKLALFFYGFHFYSCNIINTLNMFFFMLVILLLLSISGFDISIDLFLIKCLIFSLIFITVLIICHHIGIFNFRYFLPYVYTFAFIDGLFLVIYLNNALHHLLTVFITISTITILRFCCFSRLCYIFTCVIT